MVHAFSPSAARRAAFAERFGFPLCDSLETILGDASVEAVAVFTPPATHRDIGLACAAAGKHVLMEKPLEITTARAEALVAGCRAAGVRLGIVLQHRFRPAGMRLARDPAGGRARARSSAARRRSGCGGRRAITTSRGAARWRATAAGC